jgi:hypothetical protein
MEVNVTICLLKDSHGNKDVVSFSDSCDNVFVGRLRDKEGNPAPFGREAYHLEGFCIRNAVELKTIVVNDDFDKLWEKE